jgi:hypothetical protein
VALMLQDELNQQFGFLVPEPIMALMAEIITIADEKDTTDFDETTAGLMFSGYFNHLLSLRSDPQATTDWSRNLSGRYPFTPVEFFPVFTAGVDGIAWGPLVHAPELQLADYPWAEYSPMEHEGDRCCLLGQNSIEALEQILSERLAIIENRTDEDYGWDEQAQEALIYKLAASLNLQVSATKSRDFSHWTSTPIVPFIPPNYRFLATSDGVGVLAPADRFHSDSQELQLADSVEECHELVQRYLASHHPATALGIIREFYLQEVLDLEPISADWIEIYEQLGRSILAREIEHGVLYEQHQKERRDEDTVSSMTTVELIRFNDETIASSTTMSLAEFLLDKLSP